MSIGEETIMSIQEMMPLAQNGLVGLLIIMLGLIRIPKIDLNFWSLLARGLGRALNKEMMERVDKIDAELNQHIKNTEEERARQARQRILRFSDEILFEKGHSKEHYDEILEDIDKYEAYCKEHPLFVNNKAVMAIETIKDAYQECIDTHGFLVYKKNKAS